MEYAVVDSFEPIVHEWDELAVRVRAPPFLRPGWFVAWWSAFGHGRLEIGVLRRNGELAGVAPLFRRRGARLAVANVHSPHFSFLAADAERALVAQVFASSPLRTAFCYLDASDPGTAAIERGARAAGRRLLAVPIQRSPYVETAGSWEAFESGLATRFVRDLRRRRRLLERDGAVEIEIAD